MPYIGKQKTTKLTEIEQFESIANRYNIKIEDPAKKESLFRKTIDILQRPNYAVANIFGAFTDRGQAVNENPLQEAWDGLTGKDKETFSDVLKDVGIENKYVKGIAGFALDIALDPTTYLGGAFLKGTGKILKGVSTTAKKIEPLAPRITALESGFSSARDALKKAFTFEGLSDKNVSKLTQVARNKMKLSKETLVEDYQQLFGKKFNTYSPEQLDSGLDLIRTNRRIEGFLKGKVDISSLDNLVNDVTDKTVKKELSSMLKSGNFSLIKYEDDVISEINTVFKDRAKIIAEKANLNIDDVYENYFPEIAKATKAIKVGAALKETDKGYLKIYKGLQNKEQIINKPIEAYLRREYEVVRNNIVSETLDELKKTGYILDDAGENLVPIFKSKGDAKAYGFMSKNNADFINNALFPEMKTIDLLAKGSGYDSFTNLFKVAVTGIFPAFHIRNFVSGIVQNYSALGAKAFNPINFTDGLAVMRGAEKELVTAGFQGTFKQLKEKLVERFGLSSRYISDLGDYVDELADGSFKIKNMSKLSPRRLGNWIETNQKAHATITALKSGKTLDEAFELAEKAGFDYSKISNFESQVMKRLIPFYTFARKNAELQLTTLSKNPERILNQIKFTNFLSEMFAGSKPTQEDLQGLPPWAAEALGFKFDGDKYITNFGLPVEEFVSRVSDPLTTSITSMNPLVKFPLEAKSGFDFFRDEQIKNITTVKEPTAKILMHPLTPQWLKDAFHVSSYEYNGKTYYKADADNLHLLRNTPLSRIQSTADKLFQDGITDITPEKIGAFLIGAQLYDIDQELQKNFNRQDLLELYQEELQERGKVWDWTQFFTKEELPEDKQ